MLELAVIWAAVATLLSLVLGAYALPKLGQQRAAWRDEALDLRKQVEELVAQADELRAQNLRLRHKLAAAEKAVRQFGEAVGKLRAVMRD